MTNWNEKAWHVATFVLPLSWDARRAANEGQAGIERRQRDRLQDLVAFAQAHSAYLANLYRDLPSPLTAVRQLPAVTNTEMMSHFDDRVTDPDVKRKDVEAFIADPVSCRARLPQSLCGVHNLRALLEHRCDLPPRLKNALYCLQRAGICPIIARSAMSLAHIWALLRGRGRLAAVFVTGGHFLGNTMMARRHHAMPWRAKTQRLFSATPSGGRVGR